MAIYSYRSREEFGEALETRAVICNGHIFGSEKVYWHKSDPLKWDGDYKMTLIWEDVDEDMDYKKNRNNETIAHRGF